MSDSFDWFVVSVLPLKILDTSSLTRDRKYGLLMIGQANASSNLYGTAFVLGILYLLILKVIDISVKTKLLFYYKQYS